MKDIDISFDRWLELLQKTVQGNNWKALHPKFNTDNSYYREMKNYLDCVLDSSYDLIEDKFHPSMYADLKKIMNSIDNNMNVWKAFSESASIDFMRQYLLDHKMRPTVYDIKQFQELFIRAVKLDSYRSSPDEAQWDLLEIMAELNKISLDQGKSLDQAFGLTATVGHPINNPYEVPSYIDSMVRSMISDDISQAEAIRNQLADKKTPNHSEEHYKNMMGKHKWSALNDFLFDRCINGKKTLGDDELKRISKNWDNIDMPKTLEITPYFIHGEIVRIAKSEGKVIKVNKSLH
jgi:hypothetical protein